MPSNQMIVNYVPGDECRVAIVEDGKLEELHAERFASASRVGNIYVGKVTNVEASIQAAFVDFGVEDNGFLHYSDLHPRYFPGEDVDETTERVGHKTPRRERPPIQHCLRRGQEVIVQVLKEGVGTKGPTLTSYLSIPGKYLVMMPFMDKVGVSRKVEDEELRAKMRAILDQLDLPDGFGFILRTAGMDRTKAELKRDLAYLLRLWKDMEKRLTGGSKPRLLYSESDLLVRCLRDQLTSEINEVIIDNEVALERAARFMKIVAPRSSTKLLHYPGMAPVFHAFGVEKQIATIHAREVPLPSGGRLVIDQTEALVAIDVNSGKARDARDAETNAFNTNLEAVDEICRQLRLRDMGGIIVNDLIDMRHASHRKEIENRFKERLKRDKARTTTAPISLFGILEMTRQRMRGSHEQVHFSDCPTCRGRGLVQKADSVASDALRELASVLDVEKIARVEMVVAPRVAGELLSSKRKLLGRIERASGKHVDVRVSEAVPLDRVTFYGYDASGADIDVSNLPASKRAADLREWEYRPPAGETEDDGWSADAQAESAAAEQAEQAEEEHLPEPEPHPIEFDEIEDVPGPVGPPSGSTGGDGERGGRRRRRRRGRGGRGRSGDGQNPQPPRQSEQPARPSAGPADRAPADAQPAAPRAGVIPGGFHGDEDDSGGTQAPQAPLPDQGSDEHVNGQAAGQPPGPDAERGGRRRRRRRRGRGGRGGNGPVNGGGQPTNQSSPQNDQDTIQPGGPEPDRQDNRPNDPARSGGYRNPKRDNATQPQPAAESADGDFEPGDDAPDSGSPEANQADGQPGEGGRRRRRRRRGRGGRGGRGGSNQGGNPQGGPSSNGQPANQSGNQGGSSPPAPRPAPGAVPGAAQSAPPPPPKPAPTADAAPAPKGPKLLYGFRRKLTPSELAKRPKQE